MKSYIVESRTDIFFMERVKSHKTEYLNKDTLKIQKKSFVEGDLIYICESPQENKSLNIAIPSPKEGSSISYLKHFPKIKETYFSSFCFSSFINFKMPASITERPYLQESAQRSERLQNKLEYMKDRCGYFKKGSRFKKYFRTAKDRIKKVYDEKR